MYPRRGAGAKFKFDGGATLSIHILAHNTP
jgi:hypothetical protein